MDSSRRNELYEHAKRADYEIPKLQSMPIGELVAFARESGVEATSGLPRHELIFEILKRKVTKQGLGWGDGTLDILPDGFGFLRSKRYNYRPGSDDIYVSPSQIRRLNLRQGHVVAGPIRPPKDNEKYFALLHIETVNGIAADEFGPTIPFEDLTPRIPNQRITLEHPGGGLDLRLIDLLAPTGKGQRTLVLAPPHCGRTTLLANIARGILANQDDVYVMLALL
ncbi:MAG: Rho termination factor N-terminal domain-containing protein, partial [Planctomycetes bacterium]|nr:Rho termination factor N-terminal domain-containing protein [Planctomycetota bacterium]